MNSIDFYAAQIIENDGWEYQSLTKSGEMVFTRLINGVVYSATVKEDQ